MSESDSDEDYEETIKAKKNQSNKVPDGEYICELCNAVFRNKNTVYKHTQKCKIKMRQKGRPMLNKCMWCGLEFKNRGNLVAHALHMHNDSSYKTITDVKEQLFGCSVCDQSFKTNLRLRNHIRSSHFNLQAKIPYAEYKKVNQIWFEKEQNTEKILEIRKTGENKLIMRSLDENTNIKVNEVNTKVIDLSNVYPVKGMRANCTLCNLSFLKKDLKKHVEEKHLNKTKHVCNNCNRSFKRSYIYLQHRCNISRARINGVSHSKDNTEFRIASVESLRVPLG